MMTADYDVVVIGGNDVARYLAQQSVDTGARVALVVDDGEGDRAERVARCCHSVLREAAHRVQQSAQWGERVTVPTVSAMTDWGTQVALSGERARSLSGLAIQGVDVIEAPAEFRRRPQIAVVADGRTLRSRRYVIATGTEPYCPPLSGLESVFYDTLRSLWASPSKLDIDSPHHWVLIGGSAIAVELAQALHWCGQSVTLIAPGGLLPDQDAELVTLLTTHLEAEGVQILTGAVNEISPGTPDRSVQVQCAGQIIHGDRLAILEEQPRVRSLNLAALAISWDLAGIDVSFGNQTLHPTIIAINGATDSPTAYANADRWLSQQFGLGDRLGVGPPVIQVQTSPPLARIGDTEWHARSYRPASVRVWTSAQPGPRDRQLGNTTCLSKLLTRPNGQIMGAHQLGYHADDLQAVAIALHNGCPLPTTVAPTTPLGAIARSVWQQQRRSPWHWWRRWWVNCCDRLLTRG
jgi:pyruvate/2-oxoglutarate dehydrogenase complex dihydrolipoamide dehydrogenase (E3) component